MKLLSTTTGLIFGSLIALMGTLPAQALTFNLSNSGGQIAASADGSTPSLTEFTFNFNSPGDYTVDNVTFSIDSLTHNGDLSSLELYLLSPVGTDQRALTLVDSFSLSGTTMTDTLLSDSGSIAIDSASDPYTGTFEPSGTGGTSFTNTSGSTFNQAFGGISPTGTWTLRIYNESTSTASLGTVTLNVDATAVPFEFSPATGLILLGGLGGLDYYRRRRQGKVNKDQIT